MRGLDRAGSYTISARISAGGIVIAEVEGQQLNKSRPWIVLQQPAGASLIAHFDTRHRKLWATYSLRNAQFDQTYTARLTVTESAGAGNDVPRLAGEVSARLQSTVVQEPEPPEVCPSTTGYTSICQIQLTSLPDGASPLAGQFVRTRGRISGPIGEDEFSDRIFFVQEGSGRWNGIFAVTAPFQLARVETGYEIELAGRVVEFGGVTMLERPIVTILDDSPELPAPITVTTAEAVEEAYESVLVRIENVTVTSAGQDIFTVADAAGQLQVNTSVHVPGFRPTHGQFLSSLTGIMHRPDDRGSWALIPRSAMDIVQ